MKLPCRTHSSTDANKLHWNQLSHANLTGITAHIICDVTQWVWLDAAGHVETKGMSTCQCSSQCVVSQEKSVQYCEHTVVGSPHSILW